jgi:hypothetical protein
MAVIDTGTSTAGKANVDTQFNLQTNTPGYNSVGVAQGGGDVNGPSIMSEIDNGTKIGTREVLSPEVDKDYRLRVAQDSHLDEEQFVYTSQNTGKHTHTFTTLTATVSANGLLTNSAAITTTTTGMTFGTFAEFPVTGTLTLACETSVAFSAQPVANAVIDFGLFRRGASTAFAPTDGVYFRLSSSGFQGVINNNGVETTTSVLPLSGGTGTFVYTNAQVNRYLIQVNNVSTTFWINNYKYGELPTPASANFPCKSTTLPWSIRHANTGTAGGALQATITDYRVFQRGKQAADPTGVIGNRIYGSQQGLSGGTMGSLATYANSTIPTAAVASNTALTANLISGLGGQCLETDTLAVNTDGIIMSYQVPAGSTSVMGRRLVVWGVKIDSFVSTALTAGGYNDVWSLAYGHTAVSMATAESASFTSATTKAPRRIALGSRTLAAAAAALVQMSTIQYTFQAPIYVNPGEFIALCRNRRGTAASAGAIYHTVLLDFGWE